MADPGTRRTRTTTASQILRPGASHRLVLVHGAGGSRNHFTDVMTALPSWIEPVALDLPGHGDSPGYAPATLNEAADIAVEAIHDLAIATPYALVGHSLGGGVALTMALRHPGRISHLALIATAPGLNLHPRLFAMLSGTNDVEFIKAGFPSDVDETLIDTIVRDLHRTRPKPHSGYLASGQPDLAALLPEVLVPALVIIADRDAVVSPRKSRAMAAALPHSRITTLTGNHYLPLDRPGEIASEISEFLNVAPLAYTNYSQPGDGHS